MTAQSILALLVTLFLLPLCAAAAEGVKADGKAAEAAKGKVLRAGIIGCDTSHVIAFTQILNRPDAEGDLAGVQVVAAFPGGSPDLPASIDRVAGYVEKLRGMGVEIVDSIPALLERVDVVLLESVDGRPHLEQVRPVFEAGKPVFIDKPLAGSLADALAIAELGSKHNVPWFSSSALRFSPAIAAARTDEKLGGIVGCNTWGPCEIEPHHPDLFWYGIPGVEMLFTIMGPDCQSVTRTHTSGTDVVTGVWSDGRVGTFRGNRQAPHTFGGTVFGRKSIAPAGEFAGYEPLVAEIAKFFRTRRPPVSAEETLEVMAFMEAADESKRQGGAPVKMEDVMARARQEAARRLAE